MHNTYMHIVWATPILIGVQLGSMYDFLYSKPHPHGNNACNTGSSLWIIIVSPLTWVTSFPPLPSPPLLSSPHLLPLSSSRPPHPLPAGSDTWAQYVQPPVIPGHEFLGEVMRIGKGTSPFSPSTSLSVYSCTLVGSYVLFYQVLRRSMGLRSVTTSYQRI